jgi:hypothetical protein
LLAIIPSEAKDRFRAKVVVTASRESDPSVASLLQDDAQSEPATSNQ